MNENRIRNAYRNPSQLTDEDIAEMQKRAIADNKRWKTRKRREENAGGLDPAENERQQRYHEIRRKKKRRDSNWLHRDLSELEIAQLKSAWPAE